MKKMAEVVEQINVISKRKYEFLKSFRNSISKEEEELIRIYEENQYKPYKSAPKREPEPKPELIQHIGLKKMTQMFRQQWEHNEKKKLVTNDQNRKMLIALCKYFGRLEGPLVLSKGLLIMGGTGTGKTSSMKAFHAIGERIYNERKDPFMKFSWSNCIDLVDEYEDESNDKLLFFQNYRGAHRMFDDFGQEGDASRYGKKNILKEILEKRYACGTHWRTYVTTNLTESQIREKYGKRVYSRIHEMFNIVPMIGDDFRVINNQS